MKSGQKSPLSVTFSKKWSHQTQGRWGYVLGLAVLLLFVGGCRSESDPQVGSQTNWLRSCQSSSDCGGMECVCGTCTLDCSTERSCGDMDGASCVSMNSAGAIALCGGSSAPADLCAIRCESGICPTGSSCQAGICAPDVTPSTTVAIDTSQKFQTLIGFGAGLDDSEATILAHPERAALLDAMFGDSGFNMVRVKNRFQTGADEEIAATMTLLSEATTRIGTSPTVFLYSTTPPAELKANGTRTCSNSDLGCTLARTPEGAYDYAGFAEYWRASLEAYENAGLVPSFISIQSDADWIPLEFEAEACRLWATEGAANVTLASGEVIQGEFAGYPEALAAVKAALPSGALPTFAAPEVGSSVMVPPYTDALSGSDYDALAFHLYGETPIDQDFQFIDQIGAIASESGVVAIQSEMAESGLNTAALAHHTLVRAGASAYLQRHFLTTDLSEDSAGLIGTSGDAFALLPPYHALSHFARHMGEGWRRVATDFDDASVLASAWIAPDESAFTVVLINPTDAPASVALALDESWDRELLNASVSRTVFGGQERSSDLGELSRTGVVQLPGGSMATIAFE